MDRDFTEPEPQSMLFERRPGRKLNKRQLDDVTTKDALENVRYVTKAGISPEAILTPLFTFTVRGEDPTRKYTDPDYVEPEETGGSDSEDDDDVKKQGKAKIAPTSAEDDKSEETEESSASESVHEDDGAMKERNNHQAHKVEPKTKSASVAAAGPAERSLEQGLAPTRSSGLADRSLHGPEMASRKTTPSGEEGRIETDSDKQEAKPELKGKSPMAASTSASTKDFLLHEGAVRAKSRKFAVMADMNFLESHNRRVVVTDFDVGTFQLFAEFVYSGTYTDPGAKQMMDDNRKNIQTSVPARPRRNNGETRYQRRDIRMRGPHGIGRLRGRGRVPRGGRGVAINMLGGWAAPTGAPGPDAEASSEGEAADVAETSEAAAPKGDPNPFAGRAAYNAWYETEAIGYLRPAALLESFKKCLEKHAMARQPSVLRLEEQASDILPVLLAHAKLYDFAEKWQVPDLKDLVLAKVHALLMEYDPTERGFNAIAKLIDYVFDRVPEFSPDGQLEPFRALLAHYCLVKIEDIGEDPDWNDLAGGGGDFTRMLIGGFRTTHIGRLRNRPADQRPADQAALPPDW